MTVVCAGELSTAVVVVVREQGGGYGRGLVDGLLWPLPVAHNTDRDLCDSVTCSRTLNRIFTSALLSYPFTLTEWSLNGAAGL